MEGKQSQGLQTNKLLMSKQKAHPTMKPPNVLRKELHMDKANEDVGDGKENTKKFGEEDYGDQKKAKVHQVKVRRSLLGQKTSKSMDQAFKDDEDVVNDLQQPKAKKVEAKYPRPSS